MKVEQQVCSLELAKKLKELGVKQDSLFYWVEKYPPQEDAWTTVYNEKLHETISFAKKEHISAFTVAELGALLPKIIVDKEEREMRLNLGWRFNTLPEDKWIVRYHEPKDTERQYGWTQEADTEADARASMLIYLLQNNLISFKQ